MESKYKAIKHIGEGAFSSVILALNIETNEKVAIKKMKKRRWKDTAAQAEISALQKLNHDNVIRLLDVFREDYRSYLVFECMDCDLNELVNSRNGRKLPETVILDITYQVLNGLDYIHKSSYFHRDIKPENVLVRRKITPSDDPNGSSTIIVEAKIADFGLVHDLDFSRPLTDYISTRWYRAPEVLLNCANYSTPIDVWAVGTIVAELAMLHPLFPGNNQIDQLRRIFEILGTPRISVPPPASTGGGTKFDDLTSPNINSAGDELAANTTGSWYEGAVHARKLGIAFIPSLRKPLDTVMKDVSPQLIKLVDYILVLNPSDRPTARDALGLVSHMLDRSLGRESAADMQTKKPVSNTNSQNKALISSETDQTVPSLPTRSVLNQKQPLVPPAVADAAKREESDRDEVSRSSSVVPSVPSSDNNLMSAPLSQAPAGYASSRISFTPSNMLRAEQVRHLREAKMINEAIGNESDTSNKHVISGRYSMSSMKPLPDLPDLPGDGRSSIEVSITKELHREPIHNPDIDLSSLAPSSSRRIESDSNLSTDNDDEYDSMNESILRHLAKRKETLSAAECIVPLMRVSTPVSASVPAPLMVPRSAIGSGSYSGDEVSKVYEYKGGEVNSNYGENAREITSPMSPYADRSMYSEYSFSFSSTPRMSEDLYHRESAEDSFYAPFRMSTCSRNTSENRYWLPQNTGRLRVTNMAATRGRSHSISSLESSYMTSSIRTLSSISDGEMYFEDPTPTAAAPAQNVHRLLNGDASQYPPSISSNSMVPSKKSSDRRTSLSNMRQNINSTTDSHGGSTDSATTATSGRSINSRQDVGNKRVSLLASSNSSGQGSLGARSKRSSWRFSRDSQSANLICSPILKLKLAMQSPRILKLNQGNRSDSGSNKPESKVASSNVPSNLGHKQIRLHVLRGGDDSGSNTSTPVTTTESSHTQPSRRRKESSEAPKFLLVTDDHFVHNLDENSAFVQPSLLHPFSKPTDQGDISPKNRTTKNASSAGTEAVGAHATNSKISDNIFSSTDISNKDKSTQATTTASARTNHVPIESESSLDSYMMLASANAANVAAAAEALALMESLNQMDSDGVSGEMSPVPEHGSSSGAIGNTSMSGMNKAQREWMSNIHYMRKKLVAAGKGSNDGRPQNQHQNDPNIARKRRSTGCDLRPTPMHTRDFLVLKSNNHRRHKSTKSLKSLTSITRSVASTTGSKDDKELGKRDSTESHHTNNKGESGGSSRSSYRQRSKGFVQAMASRRAREAEIARKYVRDAAIMSTARNKNAAAAKATAAASYIGTSGMSLLDSLDNMELVFALDNIIHNTTNVPTASSATIENPAASAAITTEKRDGGGSKETRDAARACEAPHGMMFLPHEKTQARSSNNAGSLGPQQRNQQQPTGKNAENRLGDTMVDLMADLDNFDRNVNFDAGLLFRQSIYQRTSPKENNDLDCPGNLIHKQQQQQQQNTRGDIYPYSSASTMNSTNRASPWKQSPNTSNVGKSPSSASKNSRIGTSSRPSFDIYSASQSFGNSSGIMRKKTSRRNLDQGQQQHEHLGASRFFLKVKSAFGSNTASHASSTGTRSPPEAPIKQYSNHMTSRTSTESRDARVSGGGLRNASSSMPPRLEFDIESSGTLMTPDSLYSSLSTSEKESKNESLSTAAAAAAAAEVLPPQSSISFNGTKATESQIFVLDYINDESGTIGTGPTARRIINENTQARLTQYDYSFGSQIFDCFDNEFLLLKTDVFSNNKNGTVGRTVQPRQKPRGGDVVQTLKGRDGARKRMDNVTAATAYTAAAINSVVARSAKARNGWAAA